MCSRKDKSLDVSNRKTQETLPSRGNADTRRQATRSPAKSGPWPGYFRRADILRISNAIWETDRPSEFDLHTRTWRWLGNLPVSGFGIDFGLPNGMCAFDCL